jgi:hypothetical protein
MDSARKLGRGRAARASLAAAWLLAAAAPAAAATLDFLHIEANEGGSSGGHAALRFGDATYHFQNVDGLLLLVREDSQRFVHDYALLENRPIHVSRIEVADDAAEAARERFHARLEAQRSQQHALADARAERALLARLVARARGEAPAPGEGLALPGAGYFEAAASARGSDPVLAELRARIVAGWGARGFAHRRAARRAAIAGLAPYLAVRAPSTLGADTRLLFSYGFGARYADLAAGLVALDVLEAARPLRVELLRGSDDPALQLGWDERLAVRTYADRLRHSLERLFEGTQPDWGTASLVGMARLVAAEASLRDGRLRVLDAYSDAAPSLDRRLLARRRELLPAVAEESGGIARDALRSLVARGASQAAWADVEDAANRHLEVLGAWREGRAMRAEPERLVPKRSEALSEPVALVAPPATLERALHVAEGRERWLEGELERTFGYHLLTHNCVSELFETLNSAFADPTQAAAALGAHIDGRSRFAFIPFVSADRVGHRYRVRQTFTIPSLRQARLEQMSAEEGAARVWLRETSPLSARAGRPGARDSFFLFYTDDVVWPRPVLGALNLAAGAGATLTGLLAAPLDGGRLLGRGLRGALMSLPELAFVSLRKGTHDWVPRDSWRELDASSRAPAPPTESPAAFEPTAAVR